MGCKNCFRRNFSLLPTTEIQTKLHNLRQAKYGYLEAFTYIYICIYLYVSKNCFNFTHYGK